MKNIIEYKGYHGSVEFSAEDDVFFGQIEFINDLVTFEGDNVAALKTAFKEAVDDYIETCKQIDKRPQKPFKGSFNVRIKPELHKDAALAALKKKMSLNKFVETAIAHELDMR